MSGNTKSNKTKGYPKEFRLEAVRMAINSGSIPQTAKDLGISDKSLYKWVAAYQKDGKDAFPGKGHLKPEDEELRRLRRENQKLKEANAILKKAASYFATQMK